MAHNGDPVDKDGKNIGWVTSCAIDSERFLTGQAYVELAYMAVDTPIFVHQGGALRLAQDESMDCPVTAVKVVSRFAKL